jgi:hypothetical protein
MGRRGYALLLLALVLVLLGIGGAAALFGLARLVDPVAAALGGSALVLGIGALTAALALIARLRVLRGRIPICAGCKQVRDASGSWNRLEAYLEAHSHAEFTHGLCDPCKGALNARTLALRSASGLADWTI